MTSKILMQDALTAATGLSAASQQFTVVKRIGNTVAPLVAATDKPYGVLLNSPQVGEVAEVLRIGKTKLRAGAVDLSVDALLTSGADGAAVSAASGMFIIGRVDAVYNADNDGAIVTADVNFLSLGRATTAGG